MICRKWCQTVFTGVITRTQQGVPKCRGMCQPSPIKKVRRSEVVMEGHLVYPKAKLMRRSLNLPSKVCLVTGSQPQILAMPSVPVTSLHYLVLWPVYTVLFCPPYSPYGLHSTPLHSSDLYPKCVFEKDYVWYASRVWVKVRVRFRLGGHYLYLCLYMFYCFVNVILFCIFLHKKSSD